MSFARYPAYKDSGVEWLGEVPGHWEVKPLKKLGKLITGLTPPTDNPENYEDLDGFPWLRPEDINEAGAPSVATKYLSQKGWDLTRKVPQWSTLICCIGTIGKTGFLLDAASTNQQITAISFHYASKYFYYAACALKDAMECEATGNVVRILNSERLGSIFSTAPPRQEAMAIATFLDIETAKIDGLMAKQRALVALLKEKRQAVISHAVTKGLNPAAPMKDSGVAWLGEVPGHWEMKRLKHISPFITVGVVVNPSTYVADEGHPFIYGGDIREGIIDWENSRRISSESSKVNSKTRLKAGDLLTVRVGAPGITAVVPIECEGGNCASVMLVRQGTFNSNWLCFAMNTRIVRFQVEVVQYGAAQEQFNISHAINFWTPTPPRIEQDAIAEYLALASKELDTLTQEAQTAIALLQERRTALISAAVTGKMDVRAAMTA